MTVYLIRHGQTQGNLERRYIGSTDQPLCPRGREALVVNVADKVCAIAEVLQIWRRMRIYRALLR